MSYQNVFPDDRSVFDERYHKFPRSVVGCGGDGVPDGSASQLVEAPGTEYAERVARELEHGFRCLFVSVARGDGSTWAATAVLDGLAVHDGVELVALQGRPEPEPLPWVASYLGVRRYARVAQSAGITTSFRVLSPLTTVTAVVAAALLGAGANLLVALGRPTASHGAAGGTILSLASVWYAVAAAAVLLAAQTVAAYLKIDPNRGGMTKLADEISKYRAGTQTYKRFIDQLALELTNTANIRCLVVDDFWLVDEITQHVLLQYLVEYADERRPELWIVFDSREGNSPTAFDKGIADPQLRSTFGDGKEPYGIRRLRCLRLEPLSRRARQDLANLIDQPERWVYPTVKLITAHDDGGIAASVTNAMKAGSSQAGHALRLLYLLSITAACGPNPLWGERKLRQALSRKDLVRADVLRQALDQDSLRMGDLGQQIADLHSLFAPTLEATRAGELRVHAEVGVYFEEHWAELELPDPSLIHLYWALYWADYRVGGREVDALWMSKHAEHLIRLPVHAAASAVAADGRLDVQLFDTTVTLTSACLKLCLPTPVPKLVRLLQFLLDNFDPPDVTRHRRLRRLARDAYGVLGQSEVLEIVIDLETAESGEPSRAPSSLADSLEGLFLECVGRSASDGLLSTAVDARVAGFIEDARLRAAWLALTIQPFIVEDAARLTAAVVHARMELPELVANTVSRRQATTDPTAADFIAVSTAVWCVALSQQLGRMPTWLLSRDLTGTLESTHKAGANVADGFDSAVLMATYLREKRTKQESLTSSDFVTDVLGEEILAMTVASATVMLSGVTLLNDSQRARIEEVQKFGADALHLTRDDMLVQRLGQRLSLIAATWRRLGFTSLASAVNVRRAQYDALLTAQDQHESPNAKQQFGLADELSEPGLTGLFAGLACAEHLINAREVAAQYLTRAVTAALALPLGDEVCAELSVLVLAHANPYRHVDWSPLLDFLLERTSDNRQTRIQTLLEDMDDSSLPRVAGWLLNIAGEPTQHTAAVLEALRSRAEAVDETSAREELRDSFDVFEIWEQSARAQLDTEPILERWQPRRASDKYPFVLYLLLSAGGTLPGRLCTEVADVLDRVDEYLGNSGVVLLAGRVATRQSTSGVELSIVIVALRRGLDRWEDQLPLDETIESYRFLKRNDAGEAAHYERRQLHAKRKMLELEEARTLGELVVRGRYAVLFLHYWQLFEEHGLKTVTAARQDEPDINELRTTEPEPFARSGPKHAFRYEFLVETRALFESDFRKSDELRDVRTRYNTAARDSIPELFDALAALASLPAEIQAILGRHREQIVERTIRIPESALVVT